MPTPFRITFYCLLLCSLVACQPSLSPEAVGPSTPENWLASTEHASLAVQPWLDSLDDPQIASLVTEGLSGNYEIKAVQARLDAAEASARIAASGLFPKLSALFSSGRSRRNTLSTALTGLPTPTRVSDFSLNFSTSWELDVWGRIRDSSQASSFDLQAAAADLQAAKLSLAAQIVQGYSDAIEAERLIELAAVTVQNYSDILVVIEESFLIGIKSALDVRLTRENLASAENRLEAARALKDSRMRNLEVFLGRYPAAGIELSANIPPLRSSVPVGLPSELINRRPDIMAAQTRLKASESRVDKAQKSLLPSFNLTGNGGTASAELEDLLDLDFLIWKIAGSISQVLFDRGKLKAERDLAQAGLAEDLADYGGVVLTAFREVESALAADSYLINREKALERAVLESGEAERIAEEQYGQGIIDIITLLDSQRRAFTAKEELIRIKNQRVRNRVDLHLALGGAFSDSGVTFLHDD